MKQGLLPPLADLGLTHERIVLLGTRNKSEADKTYAARLFGMVMGDINIVAAPQTGNTLKFAATFGFLAQDNVLEFSFPLATFGQWWETLRGGLLPSSVIVEMSDNILDGLWEGRIVQFTPQGISSIDFMTRMVVVEKKKGKRVLTLPEFTVNSPEHEVIAPIYVQSAFQVFIGLDD